MGNEWTQFIGFIVAYSGKAILFQDHFWWSPRWLPRSQLLFVDPATDTDENVIQVKDWLCNKNGLDEFTEVKDG